MILSNDSKGKQTMKKNAWTSWITVLFIGLFPVLCYAASDPVPPGVNAEEEPYEIIVPNGLSCEGDICSTDSGVTIINIKGHQTLSAQKATFNRETEIAEVSGQVRLESEGSILTAESGTFNLKNKTGDGPVSHGM